MRDQLNSDSDTLCGSLPSGAFVGGERPIGSPALQEVTPYGRTARCCRLSELLPAGRPRGPEGAVNPRGRLGRQAIGGGRGDDDGRGASAYALLPAEPIEPFRHAVVLSSHGSSARPVRTSRVRRWANCCKWRAPMARRSPPRPGRRRGGHNSGPRFPVGRVESGPAALSPVAFEAPVD